MPASFEKRGLRELPPAALDGQRVLTRVDFNVPLAEGRVTDDTRIRAAMPTIRYLRDKGARVVLLSHLGRPKGTTNPAYSLKAVQGPLEQILGAPIEFIDDPHTGAPVTRRLPRGSVALVENTRFWPGEEGNDEGFADVLATLGDLYVNDAFGTAHRAHASTARVASLVKPAVAGFLMVKELEYLGRALDQPARPFVAILGGAKISGKIDVLEALLPKVDHAIIGGAMACTFFAAMGLETGTSLVEPECIDLARNLTDRAGETLILPTGAVIAQQLSADIPIRSVPRDAIPAGWAMYDIDEASCHAFTDCIRGAKTVVWNGPMGVFETPPFDRGTIAVAHALAAATTDGATTVVGGGDSAAAIQRAGLADRVTHVSTGGGAVLEFLEGKTLPGIAALDDA